MPERLSRGERADVEALVAEAATGCALCGELGRVATRSVATAAYELVNDTSFRSELRASWGFCRAHGARFASEPGAVLGAAIVLADLSRAVVRALHGARRLDARRPCPICEVVARRERHLVAMLRRHPDASAAVVRTACPSHPRPAGPRELPEGGPVAGALPIGSLAALARERRLAAVAGAQCDAYTALAERLDRVIRHHDYRFRDEPFDDFGAVWEALALFSGTDPGARPEAGR